MFRFDMRQDRVETRDPHRFVNELDREAIEGLIARLESRAKDDVFSRLFHKYVGRLELPDDAKVLEVGCGTGAMSRFLAQREEFKGQVIGVDQSSSFIEAANRLAHGEKLGERIGFSIGDAHCLDFPAGHFDVVIAHTLISHVTEPIRVLSEMARVTRAGGTVAIFDGDYASLTYALPDHSFGQRMDMALADATFNNPRIMRDLPRLLPEQGLTAVDAWGDVRRDLRPLCGEFGAGAKGRSIGLVDDAATGNAAGHFFRFLQLLHVPGAARLLASEVGGRPVSFLASDAPVPYWNGSVTH
ncbi:MAG: methyltransferase domain-containing protein [Candidatus Thiodiazotropha sp.]